MWPPNTYTGELLMNQYQDYKINFLGIIEQIDDKARDIFCLSVILVLIFVAIFVSGNVGRAVFWGGISGISVHLFYTWKCVIILPEACYKNEIFSIIESLGYKQTQIDSQRFRIDLPRLLYFDHQDVCFSNFKGRTKIIGPRYILSIMRRKIKS